MSIKEFKCPNCGGPIQFDPGIQEMLCPYCDSTLNIEALVDLHEHLDGAEEQKPIEWGYGGEDWQEGEQDGMVVYSCRSCAGEIVADETLGATSCPFCDNPVVLTSKFAGTLRPDLLIPFKVSKEEALEALKKHYLGKRLLPAVFKDQNHLEEVKGVYVPFWLFDADTDADIEYEATRIRTWSDSSYRYTETSFFRNFRGGKVGFSKVPVDGSSAIDDLLTQSIEPYELEEALPFQTPYLAGYFANKYDVDAKEAEVVANRRIENSTETVFQDTVKGFDTVRAVRSNIKLNGGEVKYALLPVWLLSTKWKDNSYTFAMNGQTGKFVGDLPLDKGAYWKYFGKVFLATTAVLSIASWLIIGFI